MDEIQLCHEDRKCSPHGYEYKYFYNLTVHATVLKSF